VADVGPLAFLLRYLLRSDNLDRAVEMCVS
jgi:hypothetical protein